MTTAAAAEKDAAFDPEETARPRILAVDDEKDFQFMLRRWLEPRFDLVVLPHGEELLDTIDLIQPDLVMLDVGLPGPDGLTLARGLRERVSTRRTPILFLTGRRDDETFLGAVRVNASAFLTKPVEREELVARIEELLVG
ncbi:MAG: response regulator [Elusimicrobia bacterium]|nr:response regulator [Elusimicrobiota bacterium]